MDITTLFFNIIVVVSYVFSILILASSIYSLFMFKERDLKVFALVTLFNVFSGIFWITTFLAKSFNLICFPKFILGIVKVFSLLFFIAYLLILLETAIKKIREKKKK